MADPLLQLRFPMETTVPESPSPPVVHYIVTLDLNTSIVLSFSVIIFFILLFHLFTGFSRDDGGGGDEEAGTGEERRAKKMPPAVRFGSEKMVRRRSDDEECAICLEEFMAGDICQALPECNHFFHSDCIDFWFAKNFTCPICRNCVAA